MAFFQSVDWPTLGLVLGGTLLATLLRCGFGEVALTLRMLVRVLVRPPFDADPARALLAVQIQDLRKDGLIRAHHFQIGDREFDEASKAMIGERSVAALLTAHETHKARRALRGQIATRTLAMAAELAPVFGLFGTLLSLGMLPPAGVGRSGYMAAIGMAVHATMVGLLAANLLFAPLARLIERRLAVEEGERQELFDWMALQLAVSEPHLRTGHDRTGHEPRAAPVHRFSAG